MATQHPHIDKAALAQAVLAIMNAQGLKVTDVISAQDEIGFLDVSGARHNQV